MRTSTLPVVAALALTAAAQDAPKVVPKEEIVNTLTQPVTAPEQTRSLTRSFERKLVAVPRPQISTRAILFKFGTAEPEGAQSYEQIRQLGEALRDPRLKDAQLEVQGHTDNVGSDDYNQKLSEQRAAKIVELLTTLYQIPPGNLKATGKGKLEPAAGTRDSQTDEQRALNRRVVVQRVK